MVTLTLQFSEKRKNYLIYSVKVMEYSPQRKKQICDLQHVQTEY